MQLQYKNVHRLLRDKNVFHAIVVVTLCCMVVQVMRKRWLTEVQINQDKLEDAYKWLIKQSHIEDRDWELNGCEFYFKKPGLALLFKLKWGG